MSTIQPQVHTGHGHHSGHYYQQPHDSRYLGSPAQSSHYRSSPSSSSADPTRTQVRRFDVPPPQGSQYYQQPHANADLHMSSMQSDIRSPHLYPSPPATYPQYQPLHASAPYSSNSSRPIPVTPHANMYYNQSTGMPVHSSVERTMPSSRTQPYPRNAPPPSPVEDDQSARSGADSVIKKKRKRADAHQLAVLNATYERTAFPSTEERAALAKQLDTSPRSVQIWLVHPFCRYPT